MKLNKVIWAFGAIMLCLFLMVGVTGCKNKKTDAKRSTGISSEDTEFLNESDVFSEEDIETQGYSKQTSKKWYEDDEQEPDDEPNISEEEPNDEPNLPDDEPNVPEDPNYWPEEPNESPEEPNEQWL
jgi:FtsZ-interacting cell division protein ZipA